MDSDGKVGAEVARVVISVCNVTYRRPIRANRGEYLYPIAVTGNKRLLWEILTVSPGLIKRLEMVAYPSRPLGTLLLIGFVGGIVSGRL